MTKKLWSFTYWIWTLFSSGKICYLKGIGELTTTLYKHLSLYHNTFWSRKMFNIQTVCSLPFKFHVTFSSVIQKTRLRHTETRQSYNYMSSHTEDPTLSYREPDSHTQKIQVFSYRRPYAVIQLLVILSYSFTLPSHTEIPTLSYRKPYCHTITYRLVIQLVHSDYDKVTIEEIIQLMLINCVKNDRWNYHVMRMSRQLTCLLRLFQSVCLFMTRLQYDQHASLHDVSILLRELPCQCVSEKGPCRLCALVIDTRCCSLHPIITPLCISHAILAVVYLKPLCLHIHLGLVSVILSLTGGAGVRTPEGKHLSHHRRQGWPTERAWWFVYYHSCHRRRSRSRWNYT